MLNRRIFADKKIWLLFLLSLMVIVSGAFWLRPPAKIEQYAIQMSREMHQKVKNFQGVIVHSDGHLILEVYDNDFSADSYKSIASITKGVASVAAGLAIQEGRIALNDKVATYFPEINIEDLPFSTQMMTVRDLLMLRCGYEKAADSAFNYNFATLLKTPPPAAPGERFYYGHMSCLLLSEVITRATGYTLEDYLRPRLFIPLNINRLAWISHGNTSCAAGGLMLSLPDMAKIGEFYRQKGQWNGVQLLNAEWFAEATKNQSPEPQSYDGNWSSGFGYLFWRNKFGGFRSDGFGGQLLVVMPDENISIAFFSDSGNFDIPLAIIEKFITRVRAIE